MKRLFYCYPAFFNFIIAGVVYFCVQRFTDADMPKLIITSTVAVWALIYCLLNAFMGRITTEKNALFWLIVGCSVIIFSCLGFLTVSGLYWQFLWIAMVGCGSGLYCTPFQIFMKACERGKEETVTDTSGVVRAAGHYTFSWSIGFATAPLVFGSLRAETGFSLSIVLMGLMLFGLFHQKRVSGKRTAETALKPTALPAENPPDLAWVGWLLGAAGTFAISLVRCLWQPRGAELHLSQTHIMLILALVSYSQGVTALLLSRTTRWFYRAIPAAAIGLAGAVAMSLFSFGTDCFSLYFAALSGGIYFGCIYFALVFYSLNHPTRAAFNVGVNEIIVSVASILAPLLGGWAADRFGIPAAFFGAGILTVLTALVHAAAMLRLPGKQEKAQSERE